jgi:hypothetical protein
MIASFVPVDIEDDRETAEAAKLIQKKYRSMKHNKQNPAERVARVKAAILIQRCWRGYVERKKFNARRKGVVGGDAALAFLTAPAPKPPRPPPGPSFTLRVWMFMEDSESSFGAKCMSLLIMATIIFSIVVFNLQTVPQLREVVPGLAWYLFELISTFVFTMEYVVRLAVCTEGGVSRRKWIMEPGNLCDFLATMPFYVEIFQQRFRGLPGATQAFKSLRLVRLFRLFRIFKLGRYSSGMQLMFQTIRNSGEALTFLIFMLCLLVFVFGTARFPPFASLM